jgi:hypothetical protein
MFTLPDVSLLVRTKENTAFEPLLPLYTFQLLPPIDTVVWYVPSGPTFCV